MSEVTVRLFASAREMAGKEGVVLPYVHGLTVSALRKELVRLFPDLGPLVERSLVAVNRTYAPETQVIAKADEIALIPPVAGG